MLKNHFRFAFRSLLRTKLYSIINITGLSIGLAVALLIGCWIKDEFAFDRSDRNHDRIARVMQHNVISGNVQTGSAVPTPLASELRSRFGHYFQHVVLAYWLRDYVLASGEKKLTKKGRFMEADVAEVLDLHMVSGSAKAFQQPGSILLSASTARAFFGNQDAVGQSFSIDNKMVVRVAGVYADITHNTYFDNTSFIAPWDMLMAHDKGLKDFERSWDWDATELFVSLVPGVGMDRASAAIKNITLDHLAADQRAYQPAVFLHPMDRWHLYSAFKNGVNTGGQIQFVRLFAGIAIAIVILACINFMNLSTARSERRAKEVGIRKAIGSGKGQLLAQFFCESLLAAALSLIIALGLVWLSMPAFNMISGKLLTLPVSESWFWAAALSICLVTGLLAGVYPAFYLSSFQPVKTLKGRFRAGWAAVIPRRVLVVLQCVVSVTLMIGTLIVYRQIGHARSRPVGYDRQGLLSFALSTSDLATHAESIRTALLHTGNVQEMTLSSSPATVVYESFAGFSWPGMAPGSYAEFAAISVTPEYGKTLGWEFLQGRDFSREYATDSSAIVLNRAAVAFMGLRDPVGTQIKWNDKYYKVIGVIQDMVMGSPYDPPRQTVYFLPAASPSVQTARFMLIRVRPGSDMRQALSSIRETFARIAPAAPFDVKFVDLEYAAKFAAEEKIGRLAAVFSILAVIISSMGIFGMASYMAEQRVREIGIRKVLGASVFSLWRLLSREFITLILIALAIALPLSWAAMSSWLESYTYRTPLSWWIFAIAAAGTLIIMLLTISFQIVRTSGTNPVKSLKAE